MAYGIIDDGGAVFAPSNAPMGYSDWSTMSGMAPGHALVGGTAGQAGYGGGQRQVALAQNTTTAVTSAAPQSWRELFNLKGNPLGWVLMATLGYWGLSHISFNKDRRASR